jgi:hypothetical protein
MFACRFEAIGMGEGDLLGDADPLVVAENPDIGEAFVAVGDGAIALAEADVVEAGGDDGVIANGVGDEKRHADGGDRRSFFLVAGDHGVAVAQATVGFNQLEIVAEELAQSVPVVGELDPEPFLFKLGDRFFRSYPASISRGFWRWGFFSCLREAQAGQAETHQGKRENTPGERKHSRIPPKLWVRSERPWRAALLVPYNERITFRREVPRRVA